MTLFISHQPKKSNDIFKFEFSVAHVVQQIQ